MLLKLAIKKGINNNKSLLGLRAEIVAFRKEGGSQQEAKQVLSELRNDFMNNAEKEDRILELLDFVCGCCSPSLRVWEEE
ncbi:hypothetical protein [Neolewinella agarilytica]|uniref:hypothetical protein n=1 Tax=Neolewinella agarilytica TaxID=478744 RepID=UPI00235585C6|nr:hypothetical protein [Neolewinella agarilytica]